MIELRTINENNYTDCLNLKASVANENFVDSVAYSLAEAWVHYKDTKPFAIYADETMIGFVSMYVGEENYQIINFLIDDAYQKKGYGTAAAKLCIDFLYKEYSDKPEGELTKLRASIVCEPTLALCAREIELGEYLIMGRGEAATGGRKRDSITSDAMEAVLGAIYLDGGLECARAFAERFILNDIEQKHLFYDSKTILQETAQKITDAPLVYEITGEEGPEHDKSFTARVLLGGRELGSGRGHTKKAAQ